MSNNKRWLVKGSLATAGILGSLFYFNKNKAPKQVKSIQHSFQDKHPIYLPIEAGWQFVLNKLN